MEDKQKRYKRLSEGSPVEIIETLLNSIHNFFNSEIDRAASEELWNLVILGDHAVALTISEGLFGETGLTGYKKFLEKFVDEAKVGFNFSVIAQDIHNWRNVIAHQWLSVSGYSFGIDLKMFTGWTNKDSATYFNPRIYHQSFKGAFSAGGKIWKYERILTVEELQRAKERLLKKYVKQ